RARRHRKITLDRELEASQIGFQDLRLLFVGNGSKSKRSPRSPLLETHFSGGLRIADPLCQPPARNQESSAPEIQHIHRCGVHPSGLAAADLQQVVVRQSKAEADQKSKDLIPEALDRAGFKKWNRLRAHTRVSFHRAITRVSRSYPNMLREAVSSANRRPLTGGRSSQRAVRILRTGPCGKSATSPAAPKARGVCPAAPAPTPARSSRRPARQRSKDSSSALPCGYPASNGLRNRRNPIRRDWVRFAPHRHIPPAGTFRERAREGS